MFEQAMKTVSTALFPLFHITSVEGTVTHFGAAGSAFFVDTDGTFLTCWHTLTAAPLETFRYLGRLPHGQHFPHLQMEILHLDEARDIAVGRVPGLRSPGKLSFAGSEPGPGAAVCICGYPPFVNADGTQNGSIAPYPQPTFVVEHNQTIHNEISRRVLVLRDNPLFGMSGGPVVNKRGAVVGQQSLVAHAKFNRGGNNRSFTVENGLATMAGELKEALRLAKLQDAAAAGKAA